MQQRDWPKSERPREKLIRGGAGTLTDAELLAIFLRTGTPGRSVMTMATELLEDCDGLRGLFDLDHDACCRLQGMGTARYVQLQAALEISERYLAQGLKRGLTISDPAVTKRFVRSKLGGREREIFACLYLDNQHRLIAYEPLFFGTIDGAAVHPREVVKWALQHNAAAVVFAHNHPSGIAEPSQADRRITDRLKSALQLVDIRVLDHLVVGDGEVLSFAERGLL